MWSVRLQSSHIEFADALAAKRQAAALRKGRPAHNGAPVARAQALSIHLLGARGETAAYILLKPIHWNRYADEVGGLADFETWVDAKTRAQSWHSLIIQRDDPDDWAYILVHCSHPEYYLAGWCWGYEGKVDSNWSDPAGGRPAYFVKPHLLQPMDSFVPVLRGRQRHA